MAPWPGTSRPRFPRRRAPDTVNPSLWRQAQLLSKSGLFQVSETIWQVRGFDVSNITFIKGATGWIVIDPLTTAEVAKAAYDLVTEKLGGAAGRRLGWQPRRGPRARRRNAVPVRS